MLVHGPHGRLIAPGEGDALVVQLDPYDAPVARWLESEGPLRVVPAAGVTGEARLAEVFVDKAPDGRYLIGDELVHPSAGGELFSVPGDDPGALLRCLLHYAKDNLALRLARRCRDLPGALNVHVWTAASCRRSARRTCRTLLYPR